MNFSYSHKCILSRILLLILALCVVSFDYADSTRALADDALVMKRRGQISAIDLTKLSSLKNVFDGLFKMPDSAQISELKTVESTSVALRAAWEQVRASVHPDFQESSLEIDQKILRHFVGFVEGRLGINLPSRWRDAIKTARAHSRQNIFFQLSPEGYPNLSFGIRTKNGVYLEKKDSQVNLVLDAGPVAVPDELVTVGRQDINCCLTSSCTRDQAFVAIHSDFPTSFSLSSIDRRNSKLLWKSTVWPILENLTYTGAGYAHYVDICVSGRSVYVFGVTNYSVYVQAFNAADGCPLFRFVSN